MKILRKEKGVTLVALVVTIIVMLILVSITVTILTGDNGLITKAKKIKQNIAQSEVEGQTKINALKNEEKSIEDGTVVLGDENAPQFTITITDVTKTSFKINVNIIKEVVSGIAKVEYSIDDGEHYITPENNQAKYYTFENLEAGIEYKVRVKVTDKENNSGIVIKTATTKESLVTAFKNGKIKIGDYVDYVPDSNRSYTSVTYENGWSEQAYEVDTNTTWRVLGLSEDEENVLLISGSPIKKTMNSNSDDYWDNDPYLYLKGAYAYEYSEKILNDICSIYSSKWGTARSITVEDVNRTVGVKVENDRVFFEDYPNFDINEYSGLGRIYVTNSYSGTPKNYIDDTYPISGKRLIQNAYSYWIGDIIDNTIGNTTLRSLLFDGTTEDDDYSKSYWLASPQIYVHSSGGGCVASLGYDPYSGYYDDFDYSDVSYGIATVDDWYVEEDDMFSSDADWRAMRYAVRPVVVLNSDVLLGDITISENQNVKEDSWAGFDTYWYMEGDYYNGQAGVHEGY